MADSVLPPFLFDPLRRELTVVYGPAGSGKTTLAMLAASFMATQHKATIYIDSERNFSLERYRQLLGTDTGALDLLLLSRPRDFQEQHERINSLLSFVHTVGLIVVDTIGVFYRQEIKKNVELANDLLAKQIRLLHELSKHVPVIVTNQVYEDLTRMATKMVGFSKIERWCHRLIELKKNPRTIILHKPEQMKKEFTIVSQGFEVHP